MVYTPARCDTLFIPSGPEGDHLFVITTDACTQGKHILASMSRIKEGRRYDPTCILEVGVHPFVRTRSFIAYNHARIEGANRITHLVDGMVWRPSVAATPELTQQILAGYIVSPFTPRFVKAYMRSVGLA